ncbi:hypothetical protein ROZALSC1DRAFT_22481 [Rozella allomycis CSF55]|uniref:Uncharacterized protein n=1 Tax=Rozella allomycis (strain CSF55) TaxID=988480 RepID=A0A4P9YI26_ROZAC|nr:hypothetical protein ROZALSC1DRAFT_22481 [Rozella allomycis CSF55]
MENGRRMLPFYPNYSPCGYFSNMRLSGFVWLSNSAPSTERLFATGQLFEHIANARNTCYVSRPIPAGHDSHGTSYMIDISKFWPNIRQCDSAFRVLVSCFVTNSSSIQASSSEGSISFSKGYQRFRFFVHVTGCFWKLSYKPVTRRLRVARPGSEK